MKATTIKSNFMTKPPGLKRFMRRFSKNPDSLKVEIYDDKPGRSKSINGLRGWPRRLRIK